MTWCVMVRAEEQHGLDYNHLEQSEKKQAGTCLNAAVFHCTDKGAWRSRLPLNTCNVSSCTSFCFSLDGALLFR